jgi:hypothetical protein
MECDATIEGSPYDKLTYPDAYNRKLACFDPLGGLCCQVICRSGYRCQNRAIHAVDVSSLTSVQPNYCTRTMYQPKSQSRSSSELHVCGYHWDRIKSRKDAALEWVSWGLKGACVLGASTAALLTVSTGLGLLALPAAGALASGVGSAIQNVVEDAAKSQGAELVSKRQYSGLRRRLPRRRQYLF